MNESGPEVDYTHQAGLEPLGPTSPRNAYQPVPSHAPYTPQDQAQTQQTPYTPSQDQYQQSQYTTQNSPYTSDKPSHGGPPTVGTYEHIHQPQHERRILGLRLATFLLSLALLVVIIAAAVGGGVGGSMAVTNARNNALAQCAASSSSSSIPTATAASAALPQCTYAAASTAAWGPVQTTAPYTGCPANNQSIYTSLESTNSAQRYQIQCGLDINPTATSDILYILTTSLELCIEACGSWNSIGTSAAGGNATVPCRGVAFVPTWINGDPANPRDCVLKSNNALVVSNTSVDGHYVDSAVVVS